MDINNHKQKRALMLHYGGDEMDHLFGTIPNTGDDYKTGKDKLTAPFNQGENSDLEEINFRDISQNEG